MENFMNPFSGIRVTRNEACPYCGGHEYSSTGLATVNGIEVACVNCGQTFYVIPFPGSNCKDYLGYGVDS